MSTKENMDVLKEANFVSNQGEDVAADLEGKIVGLYFSASWCPPCRQFTPLLRDFHEELQNRKAPFEVVFVSLDKSENEMTEYMQTMHGDWLALPFGHDLIRALRARYDVDLVPRLVVVRSDGSVITATGRKEIQDKGVAAFRLWQDAANRSAVRPTTVSGS